MNYAKLHSHGAAAYIDDIIETEDDLYEYENRGGLESYLMYRRKAVCSPQKEVKI